MIQQKYVKNVSALNDTQKEYFKLLAEYPIVFGIGAAGSGKSYIATCHASQELNKGKVGKIVLCRPVVATEDIGFLPGTFEEKLDPYLKPLFDALEDRYGIKKLKNMMDNKMIEIAPLAFLRGRTFNNSIIILDEAQNINIEQMRMLLTRLGKNTKCYITGDLTQSDLKGTNGLKWALERLKDCPIVGIIEFTNEDIVRSETVKILIEYLE